MKIGIDFQLYGARKLNQPNELGYRRFLVMRLCEHNKRVVWSFPVLLMSGFERLYLAPSGIYLLPLTPEVSCRAVSLSPIHKDPFDRLIIATALVNKTRLASVDGSFPLYPEISNLLLSS